MGIDNIIKQTNDDNNNNDNGKKKFDKDKILESLKNNKKIAGGIAGGIAGVVVISILFHHGQTIKVEQGLTKEQVKETVEDTIKPYLAQQKQNTQNANMQNTNANAQNTQTNNKTQTSLPRPNNQQQQKNNTTNTNTANKPSKPSQSLASLIGLTPKSSTPQVYHAPQELLPESLPIPQTPPELPPPVPPAPKPHPEMVFMTMPESKAQGSNGGNGWLSPEKKSQQKKRYVYIPAGSIAEGDLLYGFTAPESGVLPPVVIKIIRPVWTANNWYMPFQECLITTKAQFNVSEDLANLGGNGSILSCVLPSGRVIETKVDVAVGEDTRTEGNKVEIATMGLRGKDVWLTGKQMATIMSLYGLEGFAQGLQNIQQQQSMTAYGTVMTSIKNSTMYSLAGGVAQGMNAFIQFWLKKYQDKVPAIQVAPKHVFIVFVNGAQINVSPYKEEF